MGVYTPEARIACSVGRSVLSVASGAVRLSPWMRFTRETEVSVTFVTNGCHESKHPETMLSLAMTVVEPPSRTSNWPTVTATLVVVTCLSRHTRNCGRGCWKSVTSVRGKGKIKDNE